MNEEKRIPVLITTDNTKRGVFMGYINPKDASEAVLEATDVRMCVYWSSDVRGVLGLAANGPTKRCKISPAAPRVRLHGITSVSDISEKAEKAWEKEPWAN